MKRSLRLPFSLLLLLAIFTALISYAAFLRGLVGGGAAAPLLPADADAAAILHPPPPLNETLLRLAASTSDDPAEAEIRKDVDSLLDGNLPTAADNRHPASLYRRRENHYRSLEGRNARYTLRRLRSPKDYQIFPEFRRALRDWFRRRRFQPGIMSELVALVKTPIDSHHGRSDDATSTLRPPRRYPSCAVVGNSGILLQREQGSLIDNHDLVVRLNNARINGYQRSVGSKTDLSFVNSNILHLCARREGCFCHPYGEGVPIVMYICQPIHFLDYTLCNSSHKAPLLVTDPSFDLLCTRIVKYYSLKRFVEESGKPPGDWGKAHDERAFHYSSGMQAIVLALGICDEVSIFGFGKSNDAKHHYHTNQKAELDLHDYEAEYAFYRDLVERPQVIPFLKDSGFKVPPVVFYH